MDEKRSKLFLLGLFVCWLVFFFFVASHENGPFIVGSIHMLVVKGNEIVFYIQFVLSVILYTDVLILVRE